MAERLIRKIEEIRALPEHLRLRYVIGLVAICMIFIIGIWILTLREGFLGSVSEVNTSTEQAKEGISTVRESFPNTDSLRTLKEQSEALKVNSGTESAEQFINQELERSTKENTPNQIPQ